MVCCGPEIVPVSHRLGVMVGRDGRDGRGVGVAGRRRALFACKAYSWPLNGSIDMVMIYITQKTNCVILVRPMLEVCVWRLTRATTRGRWQGWY